MPFAPRGTSLKVVTWNVNSLRVRLPHVLKWLEREQPDVLALQETKIRDDEFPADAFSQYGYLATFSGQSAYNGVAILSRAPLADVTYDIGGGYADEQRRVLGATVGGVRLGACTCRTARASTPTSTATSSNGSRRCVRCSPTSSRVIPHCSSSATSTSR